MLQILNEEGILTDPGGLSALNLSAETVLRMYELMLKTRFMCVQGMDDAYLDRMTLFIFPLGEEAVTAGVLCLDKEDRIFTYGRYWDVEVAKGVLPKSVFDGFFDNPRKDAIQDFLSHNCSIPYVTVGMQIVHAVGAALGDKILGRKRVTVAYYGDGATAEPFFHTGLNWASIYKTPSVFVCRNNRWAISTPNELEKATSTFAEKSAAYGIPFRVVDGDDPFAVYASMKEARGQASEFKPVHLEYLTYRLGPHTTAVSDLGLRGEDEMAAARARDPLRRFRRFLFSNEGEKIFGIEWTRKKDFELMTGLAGGDRLLGLIQSARNQREDHGGDRTKWNSFAWLIEDYFPPDAGFDDALFTSDQSFIQNFGKSHRGEIKQAAKESYRESEEALSDGKTLISAGVSLNIGPRFQKPRFANHKFSPEVVQDLTLREAVGLALFDALSLDRRVVLAGEDIGKIGGVLRTTALSQKLVRAITPENVDDIILDFLPLQKKFPDRVLDTPLDENGVVGVTGIGLSLAGLRPAVEIQFSGFSPIAFDQIIELARHPQRYGGIIESFPCVIRLPFGGGKRIENHETTEIPYFANIPGLIIACPSTAQDAYDMLFAAFYSGKGVLFFEHLDLYRYARSDVRRQAPWQPLEHFGVRIAKAGKPYDECGGKSVTIATYGKLVYETLGAVEIVSKNDPEISATVLDLRVISPLDREALIHHVAKTGRLITVQEESTYFGSGAEIAATVTETKDSFEHLVAPVCRIGAPWMHHPPSKFWKFYVPQKESIADAIVEIIKEK